MNLQNGAKGTDELCRELFFEVDVQCEERH